MFRAALRKAGPTVLVVTIASALGVYVGKRTGAAIGQYRHGEGMAVLQSRVDHYVAREQHFEEVRVVDRQIQRELQAERDRLAEQAFYAYRELCRLLIDQEAARAFTASDTLEQERTDIMVLVGSENIYADDYNAWAGANPSEIEAAQRRDKARTLIRMLDKSGHNIHAGQASHLRWIYPDRREAGSDSNNIVLREARADLHIAGLLKKEEEGSSSSSSSTPPTQKK